MTDATYAPTVFPAMGTVISIRTLEPLPDGVAEVIQAVFGIWEARFSPFRADSELSALNSGRLSLREASAGFRRTRDQAMSWRVRTAGAFEPRTADGTLDLNGIVKSLAIHAAGLELTAAGVTDWCLNAGGDVLVRGTDGGTPWLVGIVDPDDRSRVLAAVPVIGARRAMATSGYAERGEHVWSVGSEVAFSQVSVLADDIVTADVLATAILAGGPATLIQMERLYDIDVLAIGPDGLCWAADVFRA